MSQWSYVKKPNWVGDGKDAYNAANIVPTTRGWEYQPTGEVLVAIRSLDAKNTDVTNAPTFLAAVSYSGTSAMVIGDTITVTLTASEAVKVSGTPTIALTLGSGSKELTYDPALSTDTSLVFSYTTQLGDTSTAGQVVVGASTTGGTISDVIEGSGILVATSVSFVAPDTSLTTIA